MLTPGQIVSKNLKDPENGTLFKEQDPEPGRWFYLHKTKAGGWSWGTATSPVVPEGTADWESVVSAATGDLVVVRAALPSFVPGERVEYTGSAVQGRTGVVAEDQSNLNTDFQVRVVWDNGDDSYTTPMILNLRVLEPAPVETPTPKRAEILREAERLITGDRNQTYGEPMENFSIIAEYWNTFLSHKLKDGEKITPGDTAGMQVLVKLAREKGGPKEDNKLDIAGYAACWAEVDG